MANEPVAFGVIGTGNSAMMMASSTVMADGIDMVVVYDKNPGRIEWFKSQLLLERPKNPELESRLRKLHDTLVYCKSQEELLSRRGLDYITVNVPSGLHAEVGVEIARAGQNAVIEKPIDVNLEAADEAIAAFQQADKVLYVVSQNRHQPDIVKAKRIIDSGDLGRVIAAHASVDWGRTQGYYDDGGWRGTWNLDGGGALTNQAIHNVDLLLHLGGKAAWVEAYGKMLRHDIQVEDWINIIGQYRDGAMLTMHATTCEYGKDTHQLRVLGTEGTLVLRDYKFVEVESVIKRGEEVVTSDVKEVEGHKALSGPMSQGGHAAQLYDIAMAIRTGRVSHAGPQEARDALEFNLAAYKSIEEGGGVRVNLPIDRKYKPDPAKMKVMLTK